MIDKRELRSVMRATRKRLAGLDTGAAARAAEQAGALPPGRIVAVYRAIGSELDVEALSRALVQAGRELCLPVVIERDAPMIFRRWSPGEPLELDEAGVPAPFPLAEVVDPCAMAAVPNPPSAISNASIRRAAAKVEQNITLSSRKSFRLFRRCARPTAQQEWHAGPAR